MPAGVSRVLKSGVAWAGWRIPCPLAGAPVILLYHGVPRKTKAGRVDAKAFQEQIFFLRQHFELIDAEGEASQRNGRPQVLLTFDDGFRNNYDVVRPILQRYQAPAVFFVNSRHAERGKYLWFAYLRVLEDWFPADKFSFRGEVFSMTAENRRRSMARLQQQLLDLRPHPQAMYAAIERELPALSDFLSEGRIADLCAGMTEDQVRELSADPLFRVGCHTVDHPFLSRAERGDMAWQLAENKRWIESLTGRVCDMVAYPSGDYDSVVLSACRDLGFTRGYAVIPASRTPAAEELPRIGIYGPSLDVLGFVGRWGSLLRAMRVPMG